MFETANPLILLPAQIDKLIVRTKDESVDLTTSNGHYGVSYYAFGAEANLDNRIYIGFDSELPLGVPLTLTIEQYDKYPVPIRTQVTNPASFHPSGKVSWKYYGADPRRGETGVSWQPLTMLKDETLHMQHGGQLTFTLPVPMKPTTVHPANDKSRYWLCCTVEEEGYELSPKLDSISMNTVKAVQQQTWSETILVDSSGAANMLFEISSHLAYYGRIEVQTREPDGSWSDWLETERLSDCRPSDSMYEIIRDAESKLTVILFGDGMHGQIPEPGKNGVRIIAYDPAFEENRYVGSSNGLPHQLFELGKTSVKKENFLLQVGTADPKRNGLKWRDWQQVDDFELSNSSGAHYTLRTETGEIQFGDNERGMIPEPSPVINIKVISCITGGGSRGNVKQHVITRFTELDEALEGVTVTNAAFAYGGQEKETTEAAKLRLKREWKQPTRAVTADDCERLALLTPGLRVARVKAIPLFVPSLKEYPLVKAAAQMTVVAVPYSEAKKPMPSQGFLRTMKQYLDQYRLISTELHVVAPEYVRVTIQAVVVVEPHFKEESHKAVEVLNAYLQPIGLELDGSGEASGWTFGRPVYRGDLYGVLNTIPGVHYVQDLWLVAEGNGIRKEVNGDVIIPPHGLVYSGDHEIEFVTR
jgi:hypothetical protein